MLTKPELEKGKLTKLDFFSVSQEERKCGGKGGKANLYKKEKGAE